MSFGSKCDHTHWEEANNAIRWILLCLWWSSTMHRFKWTNLLYNLNSCQDKDSFVVKVLCSDFICLLWWFFFFGKFQRLPLQQWWMNCCGVSVKTICIQIFASVYNVLLHTMQYIYIFLKQSISNNVHCHFYFVKCSSKIRTCIEFAMCLKRNANKSKSTHLFPSSSISIYIITNVSMLTVHSIVWTSALLIRFFH